MLSKIITYDCEVFAYDWLVTFKAKETGEFTCIWNDAETLKECIHDEYIYIGFNSKHYDQYIIKAICCGATNEQVKAINNFIISGKQGWEHPFLAGKKFEFNNVDIRDDMQPTLSLKAIEGHLYMPIQESSVPFDIDRPLTDAERTETEFYCKHDVDTTEKLIDIRKDYLTNKINLGELAGIEPASALAMTNAKLTAAMLQAKQQEHSDEREYKYPLNLLRKYIPQEVFDFFNRMYDKSLTDEEVFTSKLELSIGECPVTIGFGGIHGAIPNFFWQESETRGIWNEDVGSFYPHLMTINGYTSRNIPSPKIYEDVLDRRMKAKAAGDKRTANALKLVCNTTYGCLLNQYNDLYDPLMGRSVCISGQLYLLELAEHCYQAIEGLRIVQLNTDGIMVECGKKDYPKLTEICSEWQKRTGFELEEDTIAKIAQKDVNNYIEVQQDGTAKAKGGYLVRGVAPAGAFNINNTCTIVATALKEYFVNGVPVEKTINDCNDIYQFQIIAKAGAKYKEAYRMFNGERKSIQKVNRVYASTDTRCGKLYKTKAETDSTAKIESLPEHCIIDNDNFLTTADIDKQFYIDLANKRINDFKGIKEDKKMATATKAQANVYQKLIDARERFVNSEINQSGKNMQLSFKYFELKDIVPTITRIFKEVGLLALTRFGDNIATLTVVNTDAPEETIDFPLPFKPIEPIMSKDGKQVINDMQALGSSVTYIRRYLYLIAMDICVSDDIEPQINGNTNNQGGATAAKKAPAAPEQRAKTKVALTGANEPATELQVKGLKAQLKKLKDARPDKEEWIAALSVKSKGFTTLTKEQCEKTIQAVQELLKANEKS